MIRIRSVTCLGRIRMEIEFRKTKMTPRRPPTRGKNAAERPSSSSLVDPLFREKGRTVRNPRAVKKPLKQDLSMVRPIVHHEGINSPSHSDENLVK